MLSFSRFPSHWDIILYIFILGYGWFFSLFQHNDRSPSLVAVPVRPEYIHSRGVGGGPWDVWSSVAVWIHIQCTHDRVCWASSVTTWIYNIFNAREVVWWVGCCGLNILFMRGQKSHSVCVFIVVRLDNSWPYHYCLTILIIRPTPLTSSFYPLLTWNTTHRVQRHFPPLVVRTASSLRPWQEVGEAQRGETEGVLPQGLSAQFGEFCSSITDWATADFSATYLRNASQRKRNS